MQKFAVAQILDAELATGPKLSMARMAHRVSFDYEPREGYLYVRSRMISSRCNDNFDEFPAEEIKKAYRTFIGKPVFVNHHNEDHRRARGVIIDAALHEDRNPDGSPDTWVEGLMEVDAVRFPKLAKAVLAGHIDRTSMGVDVEYSLCSICANRATTPLEYCAHIPTMKGITHTRIEASTGERKRTLVRERCHGLRFFENSLLVEEPADPTAYTLGKVELGPGLEHLSMNRTASRMPRVPSPGPAPVPMPRVQASGPPPAAMPTYEPMRHEAALSVIAHGGLCPACHSSDTISIHGSAECGACEHSYMLFEAAPRYADPGNHPFFQQNPAHADHVLKMWHNATEDEQESGRRWYADAGLVSKGLGTLHSGKHPGGNTHLAAGLIANYSPQTGWAANQHNAARAIHGGKGIGGKGSGIFASDQQRKAADRMIGGEMHTSVLTSPKVSDFAHLVEHGGDKDEDDPHTVIDRHALSVATGRRMSNEDYNAFPKTQRHYYGHVVNAYHQAAKVISDTTGRYTPAHAVQAATWLAQQRHNQISEAANVGTNRERLDIGRHRSRQRQESEWNQFRQTHLPDLHADPGTGYSNESKSASRGRRGRR